MLGHVTVVGCGLIGGSLIKCLRERRAATRLSAVDRDDVIAMARPYLDGHAAPASSHAAEIMAKSEIVVLATPALSIAADVAWALSKIGPDAVVTDTGSVKSPIVEAAWRDAKGARFVGGHPMSGREIGGFDASTPDLFERAKWFVVPSLRAGASRADGRAVSLVLALADAVGAEPAIIDAEAHDRSMAYVSHVPQLLASALYAIAVQAGVVGDGGPGFRDMTRIAGGPASIWRDIFATNRVPVAAALEQILEPLLRLRDTLAEGGDAAVLEALSLLERAQNAKGARISSKRPSRGSPP